MSASRDQELCILRNMDSEVEQISHMNVEISTGEKRIPSNSKDPEEDNKNEIKFSQLEN